MFEIGTEELPAAYLPSLIEQLGAEARALLEAHHLSFRTVESCGTPRRLVLVVRGLAGAQRKPGEEVRGPSRRVSYDGAGKPTKALLGFLRSQGGALSRVKVRASEKGEYVYLVKPPTATLTSTILPALLPQLVGKLRAPKTMRWDASGVRFARPIRWLLALYGSTPLRCSLGTLASVPRTQGGGPLRPKTIAVHSIEQYLRALQRAGVTLDQDARRAWIEQTVARVARQSCGQAAPEMVSHGLLDEVTHLVEQPVALAGQFDPRYLALPREVLLASMAKYQRVFAIEARGKLLPRFVAILEGKPGRPNEVRAVIERILNARLADSLTFWKEDHARLPLERMATGLSGVTFHEKLGSMADKTERVHTLSAVLEKAWQLSREELKDLRRACQLAKADLVSTLVKEFPTLQGVIGKYYARNSREPQEVAEAIEEHYLPIGDRLPQTLIGSALAVLDKYDTLASYFAQGIVPTGDQDPFGLRRAAQGIVEVAWAVHRPLPIERLLEARAAMPPFSEGHQDPVTHVGNVHQRLRQYLAERLYTFSWPAPAPSHDLIEAVLSTEPRKREVDPARFQEPLERTLWDIYASRKDEVERLAQQKSYGEATRLFGEVFYEPLHEFFDRVMVNVPDEPLQQNRLALMRAINTLYTDRIADLSKLTILHNHEESR
ncbi:MAG: glycine--tRNA ligase subunit beta [Candidatus Omnitrophica bacterium]|nr:glycine--tRNA ligase subunit beta [Candidatus Omnitrophota bacterium]